MTDHGTGCSSGCGDGPRGLAGDGIGRRTFLAQGAMLAALGALAACGAAGDSTAPSLSGTTSIKLADYPALATVGGIAVLTINSSPYAVARTGASTFVTVSRRCTHEGTTVNVNGSGFLCPNHLARFAVDGTWQGGQHTSSLQTYPTSYDATSGTVTIG